MFEDEPSMEIPPLQKMQRQNTLDMEHKVEHKAALQRAVTLAVPDAFSPSYGTFEESSIEVDDGSSVSGNNRAKSWYELIN